MVTVDDYINAIDNKEDLILYTLKGCNACEIVKEELFDAIKNGKIKVKECNYDTKKGKTICKIVDEMEDFENYPSIYKNNGEKVI